MKLHSEERRKRRTAEIDREIAQDPIVQRKGRANMAALERAAKAVDRKFIFAGGWLLRGIEKCLAWDERASPYLLDITENHLHSIEGSLGDFSAEELLLVSDISKALAKLSERAREWSDRLPQVSDDVVEAERAAERQTVERRFEAIDFTVGLCDCDPQIERRRA